MKLNNIFPFGQSSQILVCETDGFSLRGAVLNRSGKQVKVLQTAQSQLSDMDEAVKEVINQLKMDGWNGNRVILLSPAVLSTLVELPVDPQKSRPISQMQELIRWEVEPLLMQHNTRWTVDYLLVGCGYMTVEQAQTVIDMQQGKPNPTGMLDLTDNISSRSFGDLAIELGYIRQSQLNACLARLEWLKINSELTDSDSIIDCGWTDQGEVADVPGMYSWLVSCLDQTLLERWIETFHNHGMKLQAVYPLTGSSSTLINNTTDANVIIESHKGMSFITQIKDEKVVFQHQYDNLEKSALDCCLESFHALNIKPSEAVFLASWHEDTQPLIDELQQTITNNISSLSSIYNMNDVSLGMIGTFHHALKLSNESLCVEVRVGGPLPPLWQRQSTRSMVLLLVLLSLIGTTELSFLIWKHHVVSEKTVLDEQWATIDDASKRIQSQITQVNKRKDLLAQQQQDQIRLQTLLDFYSNDIPERVDLVQGILGILQDVVTDEIVIESVDESGKRATFKAALKTLGRSDKRIEIENFNLEAWALSEASAQNFIQDLKQAITPWNLEIREPQVMARPGPLSLSGFTIAVRIVKLLPQSRATIQ